MHIRIVLIDKRYKNQTMSKQEFKVICPNCKKKMKLSSIYLELPQRVHTTCGACYYPLIHYPKKQETEIAFYDAHKFAFLIHSSDKSEKNLLDYFRQLLKMYGIETFIIENDNRSVDWLQKSLDGIKKADLVIAFLTKRYQFCDVSGNVTGWKAPDKCYEEVAISFALQKEILALVEKDVEMGNILETRAWCYRFERGEETKSYFKDIDIDIFVQLASFLGFNAEKRV